MSVSPPFCCRSVWHQECKLDGVERGGKPKPQRIFPSFRTDAGGYGTRATREREREGDRQTSSIPFLFNKLPAGRSSHCFIYNEKERLLDTIWEGDNGIRGGEKTGKRRRNFPTSAAQNLPPLSRVFTSPLWGDDRAPLARPQARCKRHQKRNHGAAEMSDKTSIFSPVPAQSARPPVPRRSMTARRILKCRRSRSLAFSFVFVGSKQRQKKCGRRRNASRDTNPKSLPLARSASLTEASGVGGG